MDEEITEYPQANPAKRSHRRAWSIAIASVIAAGIIVAGLFVVPPVVNAANVAAYNTAQAKAQSEVPAAPLGDATTGGEQQTLAKSDADGGQAIATEQAVLAAQAAAAAAAAAQAAAQQTADDAAAKDAAAGHTTCPAGSMATSGDGDVDFTCLPDICFNITLPDPNHPECNAPFKP
jgi:cytoskeletal protein RodZ